MAPFVNLAIQLLLGVTPITDNRFSTKKPETVQVSHHKVEVSSPVTRSSISLSSVTWGHNRLDVLGSCLTHGNVKHKYWDGYQWGPSVAALESLGGFTSSPPAAVSWGKDRFDIFIVGENNGVQHKYWDGTSYKPSEKDWENLGGKISYSYALAATAWAPNRLDIFGIGLDRDEKNALWHKYWDGSSWGPSEADWEHLGGDFISEPAAVSWGPDRIDVFVVDTKRNLLHKFWDGINWNAWEKLGDSFVSTPTAISWGKNRLDVFGVRSDSQLYHRFWDGSQWSDWEDFGGEFAGAVAATSWAPDRLDVVGLGTDYQYYYKYWDGHQWNPSLDDWYSKNGSFYSAPSLVSWGENRLDIFGIDLDYQLAHQTWYGSGWYPSSDTWETLGGVLQPF